MAEDSTNSNLKFIIIILLLLLILGAILGGIYFFFIRGMITKTVITKEAPPSPADTIVAPAQPEVPTPKQVVMGEAANWRELAAALPKSLAGYEAEPIDGSTVTSPMGKWSHASQTFLNPQGRAQFTIIDSAGVEQAIMPWYSFFEIDTAQIYTKRTTFQGYPAIEHVDYTSNEVQFLILVENRFLITINAEPSEISVVKQYAGMVDYNKLKSLV